jgi:uncharacterized damage-inducible protein DinB
MNGRPQKSEAASYYWKYIDKVEGDDPIAALERQLAEAMELLAEISEERSTHRYAPEKWSIRQVLNHTTDTERADAYRALWFGRGFTGAFEFFNDKTAADGAQADRVSWAAHVEDFLRVRQATISLFHNMPDEAWIRAGVVGGNSISVRALAFLTAGHVAHHLQIVRERYLA